MCGPLVARDLGEVDDPVIIRNLKCAAARQARCRLNVTARELGLQFGLGLDEIFIILGFDVPCVPTML